MPYYRSVTGAGTLLTALFAISGCASGTPVAGSALSPALLAVTCTPDGVVVGGDSVAAGPSGPELEVSSTAAAGTYLHLRWPGGGQGDPAPVAPTRWTLGVQPGELELSCGEDAFDGVSAVVTVNDPGGHWQTTTLEDLGCGGGAVPSWAVGPGTGSSPRAAIADLIRQMEAVRDGHGSDLVVPEEPAPIGYIRAPTQTWIVADEEGRPSFSAAVVSADGADGEAVAHPDRVCG